MESANQNILVLYDTITITDNNTELIVSKIIDSTIPLSDPLPFDKATAINLTQPHLFTNEPLFGVDVPLSKYNSDQNLVTEFVSADRNYIRLELNFSPDVNFPIASDILFELSYKFDSSNVNVLLIAPFLFFGKFTAVTYIPMPDGAINLDYKCRVLDKYRNPIIVKQDVYEPPILVTPLLSLGIQIVNSDIDIATLGNIIKLNRSSRFVSSSNSNISNSIDEFYNNCDIQISKNTNVTITIPHIITVDSGFLVFQGFYDYTLSLLAHNTTFSFTMPGGNMSITALYKLTVNPLIIDYIVADYYSIYTATNKKIYVRSWFRSIPFKPISGMFYIAPVELANPILEQKGLITQNQSFTNSQTFNDFSMSHTQATSALDCCLALSSENFRKPIKIDNSGDFVNNPLNQNLNFYSIDTSTCNQDIIPLDIENSEHMGDTFICLDTPMENFVVETDGLYIFCVLQLDPKISFDNNIVS